MTIGILPKVTHIRILANRIARCGYKERIITLMCRMEVNTPTIHSQCKSRHAIKYLHESQIWILVPCCDLMKIMQRRVAQSP